jgi:hypothetical protein
VIAISFPEPAILGKGEGTRGSGIIRVREESDWPLIWNAQFDLSQDSLASGNGLSQSLTFLPEDRRLGERDGDDSEGDITRYYIQTNHKSHAYCKKTNHMQTKKKLQITNHMHINC